MRGHLVCCGYGMGEPEMSGIDAVERALRLALAFAQDEVENRSYAGGSMTDYINEAQEGRLSALRQEAPAPLSGRVRLPLQQPLGRGRRRYRTGCDRVAGRGRQAAHVSNDWWVGQRLRLAPSAIRGGAQSHIGIGLDKISEPSPLQIRSESTILGMGRHAPEQPRVAERWQRRKTWVRGRGPAQFLLQHSVKNALCASSGRLALSDGTSVKPQFKTPPGGSVKLLRPIYLRPLI